VILPSPVPVFAGSLASSNVNSQEIGASAEAVDAWVGLVGVFQDIEICIKMFFAD